MSLEDLERQLYGQGTSKERKPSPIQQPAQKKLKKDSDIPPPNPWEQKRTQGGDSLKALSFFAKYSKALIVVLIVMLVASVGAAGFYLYQFFTTRDVDVSVTAPGEVMSGVSFVISLAFENTSKKVLLNPAISLSLPDGALYVADTEKRVISADVGTMNPGDTVKQDFEVMIIGATPKTYTFGSRVTYGYEASALSSRFEKGTAIHILAREPVLALDLSAPESVLNGEDFEIHIRYQNYGPQPLRGAQLVINTPKGFRLNNSEPTLGEEGVIALDELHPGVEGVAIVSGSVVGMEGSFFPLDAIAKIRVGENYFDVNTKTASVSVAPSPLSLRMTLEGKDTWVRPGDVLQYTLSFTNNADINLSDVVLKATLKGDMFDTGRLDARLGYFDDVTRSITWTGATVPALKELGVRSSGSVSFRIPVKTTFPIRSLSDKNFVIAVEGEISSPTVPYNVTAPKTLGLSRIEHSVAGQMSFSSLIYHTEPTTSITNEGPLPPRVGQTTQYTIHWRFTAVGTDFENVTARALLGPGVRWTGRVTTNAPVAPTYNERSQEVLWPIGTLAAGQGVLTTAPELIFQIEYTPSSNQLDQSFVLMRGMEVSGTDSFTKQITTIAPNEMDSQDLSDGILPQKFDRVQP